MQRFRVSLLAGVSACALAIATPAPARAGDRPSDPAFLARAQAVIQPKWTWWIEGGPSNLDGQGAGVAGLNNPPFAVSPARWGWEVAGGFDWRFDPVWRLSGQFRYGWFGKGTNSNAPIAVFNIGTNDLVAPTPVSFAGSNSAERREEHWLADFMVGRDLGLGETVPATVRFGVRVAEIRGKTTGAAVWSNMPAKTTVATVCVTAPTPANCVTDRRDYTQYNSFFGAGPRLQFDGSIPLAPQWAIEYMAGVAGLYGRRKTTQAVNVSQSGGTAFPTFIPLPCVAGCPINASISDHAWVFNADAMVGVSYAISANYVVMVSYRFDGYWQALKGFDSNGQPANLDRFYHGVMVRLTMLQ
jgi:opacity protein-like surface antigen